MIYIGHYTSKVYAKKCSLSDRSGIEKLSVLVNNDLRSNGSVV
jgi:hypothetical protein